jgi:hypothetical protein
MSRATRSFMTSLFAGALACHNPEVTAVGGNNAGSGGSGETGDRDGGVTGIAGFGVNWSDAGAPTGGASVTPPVEGVHTCATSSAVAKAIPLDLLLLVDTSGSMAERFADQTKWQMVRAALLSFVGDPGSAELGAGLEFFPRLRPCTSAAACGMNKNRPLVCLSPSKCVMPGESLEDASDCSSQAQCANGTCTRVGVCLSTGAKCQPVGRPCAGTMASELCTAISAFCDDDLYDDPAICDPQSYLEPDVEIALLPPNAPPIGSALARAFPEGATPMKSAVSGALAHLHDYEVAHPGRKGALVLATDGMPQSCDDTDVETPVAAALAATPSISTYAIGVFSATDMQEGSRVLAGVARAGSTGQPIVLQPGANLTQAFLAALDQIRGAALPCAFAIPTISTGAIDFGKVNFHYQGAGGDMDLPYVQDARACDAVKGGWYYDVDPKTGGTPKQVILCPVSCDQVKRDPGAKVSLTFGCQTKVIE